MLWWFIRNQAPNINTQCAFKLHKILILAVKSIQSGVQAEMFDYKPNHYFAIFFTFNSLGFNLKIFCGSSVARKYANIHLSLTSIT